MHLIGIIVLALFYVGNCSSFPRSSKKPWVPATNKYGTHFTEKPRNWEKKSNTTRILETTAEVLETVANATLQSFANTYLHINEKRLLTALKGVSIFARATAFENFTFDMLEAEEIKDLVKRIEKNIEKLSENVYSDTNFYLTYEAPGVVDKMIDEELKEKKNDYVLREFKRVQLNFNTLFVRPINVSSHTMVEFMERPKLMNQSQFNKGYYEERIKNGIERSPKSIHYLIEGHLNISGSNKDNFDEIRSNITRYFFQAQLLQHFALGVNSAESPSSESFKDLKFEENHRLFIDVMKQEYRNYHKNFFPGSIKNDIVKPFIDIIIEKKGANGSNCLIAENIMVHLNEKFPSRKYAVIVADTMNKTKNYAYFGFPKRMIIDDYLGKTVFVFMATKNATENKKTHYDQDVAAFMTQMTYDGRDLNTALTYARSNAGDKYYQMAAFGTETIDSTCYCPTKSAFTDAFAFRTNEKRNAIVVIL